VDPSEDPRVGELLRSGRGKKAIAYAVIGALAVLAGVIMLGLLLQQNFDGGGYQLIVVAGGAVVIGIGCLIVAARSL
jgi:hypothetical protein